LKLNFIVGRIVDGQNVYNLIRAHTSGEAIRIAAAKGGQVIACRQIF